MMRKKCKLQLCAATEKAGCPMTIPATSDLSAGIEIELRLHSIRYEAHEIVSLEWRSPNKKPLPSFTAGAHIEFRLNETLKRCYSLINPGDMLDRYIVAVKRDPSSRGGSRFVHEQLRVGAQIRATTPRNHFRLDEAAPHSALFAGGIGITPIWAMIQELDRLGRSWELHYGARTEEHAAFLEDALLLERNGRGKVHCYFDQSAPLALTEAVEQIPSDAHVYCCGPAPMLDSFLDACVSRDQATVHIERFATASESALLSNGGCTVTLARSKRTIVVAPSQTILDALLAAGIEAPHSCKEGVCGSCEVRVVEGVPDHRDSVLSLSEKISNQSMMICCSRSKSDALVLDL
jgi:vanillate O-demethylase ferredoxin subunit